MKENQPINKDSAVYRMIQEEKKGESEVTNASSMQSTHNGHHLPSIGLNSINSQSNTFRKLQHRFDPHSPGDVETVIRPVAAPVDKPESERAAAQANQNLCFECGRLIVGVFVKINDKPLHSECFKCATCGNSLKNVGYHNINNKLYCGLHATQVARIGAPVSPAAGQQQPFGMKKISAPAAPTSPGVGVTSPIPFHTTQQTNRPVSVPSNLSHPNTAPPVGAHTHTIGAGQSFGAGPGPSAAPNRGRGTLTTQIAPGTRIPICSTCGSPIRGPFVTAMGKTWCPEHFVCGNAGCRRPLQDIGFVEEKGQIYCEACFETHLAPTCNKCRNKIKGNCLNALDKAWHPECFICAHCKRPFGSSSFYMEDGLAYCETDWNDLFTTKCVGCGYPIEAGDRWVEALNNNYHSQCFRCSVCQANLEGQSFYAKGGKPYCKNHAR